MGDKATLAKARKELEDLYLGVPDDSVNLTFQDLAEVKQLQRTTSSEKKKPHPLMTPISESTPRREVTPSHLAKLPSLDFSRGLRASSIHHDNHHHANDHQASMFSPMNNHHRPIVEDQGLHANLGHGYNSTHGDHGYGGGGHGHHGPRHGVMESSMAYDDMSGMSMASMNPYGVRGGRRRPGIPHSNICTICSVYIYIFRTRCLVCGRVYCKQCVNMGMGEMNEGRKCIDCLGKRFSQRYIGRAGDAGCWAGCCLKYPSTVKLQELKWAEKGPRRSGENRYGRTGMMSTTRSPMTPRTPSKAHMSSGPPSFVASSPYTPTHHHHLPI